MTFTELAQQIDAAQAMVDSATQVVNEREASVVVAQEALREAQNNLQAARAVVYNLHSEMRNMMMVPEPVVEPVTESVSKRTYFEESTAGMKEAVLGAQKFRGR